ncbi:hypothetical protein [Mammaliicoccus sciuri]|uniref:Uncharacterized protein n=1 Tax=Mammaliicoccus sciuri TaxID=1296 RepID=A0AAI8GV81_MAMSC|nr:hypothetical protein [Mammaliicoccus sciuri]ASE35701.1 hypothetical protein CEP64_13865 [Mammaliicoccus sciuri]
MSNIKLYVFCKEQTNSKYAPIMAKDIIGIYEEDEFPEFYMEQFEAIREAISESDYRDFVEDIVLLSGLNALYQNGMNIYDIRPTLDILNTYFDREYFNIKMYELECDEEDSSNIINLINEEGLTNYLNQREHVRLLIDILNQCSNKEVLQALFEFEGIQLSDEELTRKYVSYINDDTITGVLDPRIKIL